MRAAWWFTSRSKHFVGRPHVELLQVRVVYAGTAKRLGAARMMDRTEAVRRHDRTSRWGERTMRLREGSGTRRHPRQARGHPPLSREYAGAGSRSSSRARRWFAPASSASSWLGAP